MAINSLNSSLTLSAYTFIVTRRHVCEEIQRVQICGDSSLIYCSTTSLELDMVNKSRECNPVTQSRQTHQFALEIIRAFVKPCAHNVIE